MKIKSNIAKKFYTKNQPSKPDEFYNLSKSFTKNNLLEDFTEASIYAHRIIANTALVLKNDQIAGKKHEQTAIQLKLNFFDEEFLAEGEEFVSITLATKLIDEEFHYDRIRKALNFLKSYKSDQAIELVNSKGQKIITSCGLIESWRINKDSGNFSFNISTLWLREFVNLTEGYNKYFYNVINEIRSTKTLLFWYWLSMLPEEGTAIHYATLNEKFKLNYSSARSVCNDFLKKTKLQLDEASDISFNYSYSGDKINIAKYQRTAEDITGKLKEVSMQTFDILKKSYTLSYLKKRHKLSANETQEIKTLLKHEGKLLWDAYHLFVSNCRAQKIQITKFTGKAFLQEWQKYIILEYKNHSKSKIFPEAYPKFNCG